MGITADKEQIPPENTEYRKYEVDFETCSIAETDIVTPDTLIGYHHHNGEPVKAGFYGYVASMFFNPMHNSLMILAISFNNSINELETQKN